MEQLRECFPTSRRTLRESLDQVISSVLNGVMSLRPDPYEAKVDRVVKRFERQHPNLHAATIRDQIVHN